MQEPSNDDVEELIQEADAARFAEAFGGVVYLQCTGCGTVDGTYRDWEIVPCPLCSREGVPSEVRPYEGATVEVACSNCGHTNSAPPAASHALCTNCATMTPFSG